MFNVLVSVVLSVQMTYSKSIFTIDSQIRDTIGYPSNFSSCNFDLQFQYSPSLQNTFRSVVLCIFPTFFPPWLFWLFWKQAETVWEWQFFLVGQFLWSQFWWGGEKHKNGNSSLYLQTSGMPRTGQFYFQEFVFHIGVLSAWFLLYLGECRWLTLQTSDNWIKSCSI